MQDRPMMDRRAMLAGVLAVMATPALPAPYYPLPDGLTVEFFREAAQKLRRVALGHALRKPIIVEGIDRTGYWIELDQAFAAIFDRMGDCREPFELLESELYATERALMNKHNFRP